MYAENLDENIYLLEDLGNSVLLQKLESIRKEKTPEQANKQIIELYKKTIDNLVLLQIEGHKNLNYDFAYPRSHFDKQSILWDCNYFKYYFIKLAKIGFDEQALENDFETLANYLLQADSDCFLMRDCQARNIMLFNNQLYFIDYQGGRKGALQYDLASLLFQAKANLSDDIRAALLDYYIEKASEHIAIDEKQFKQFYDAYVLIRTIQVLGAYGFRGLYERKQHFLVSIPYALQNLESLLKRINLPIETPVLWKVLEAATQLESLRKHKKYDGTNANLIVTINSFSYKKSGIPADKSGNGGGFVFDCRAIHNPGRYQPYKKMTGQQQEVINFLKENSNIDDFLKQVYKIMSASVEKYLDRDFSSLMVNFGCTGGQHRSVYSAEQLAKYLQDTYKVNVVLKHLEAETWPK